MSQPSDGTVLGLVLLGEYAVPGRGRAVSARNPKTCENFEHLVGRSLKLGESFYRVAGVEYAMHAPPWKEGETIGLLLSETP